MASLSAKESSALPSTSVTISRRNTRDAVNDAEVCNTLNSGGILVSNDFSTATECSYNGTTYKSGSEWNDPEDPCSTYKCLGGVVTQVNLQCHTPCSFPMRPKPDSGQCCPTCVGCKYNGQTVLEGQEVTSSEDPCLKCQCNNRRLECTKKACPVVNCPLQKQVKEPGECCPKCVGQLNQMSSLHGRCLIGGKLYSNGQKFQLYGCSTCVCNNGTSFCRRVTCPVLDCPVELQTGPEDGSCCKKCPEVAEMQSVCVYNQQTYQHDETWNLDSCRSCRCVNGKRISGISIIICF